MTSKAAKLVVIALGVVLFAGFVVYGALNGLAGAWIAGGIIASVVYAECGRASFGRRRWVAVGVALLLTAIVAGATFFHVWLTLAGLVVAAGCAIRNE